MHEEVNKMKIKKELIKNNQKQNENPTTQDNVY